MFFLRPLTQYSSQHSTYTDSHAHVCRQKGRQEESPMNWQKLLVKLLPDFLFLAMFLWCEYLIFRSSSLHQPPLRIITLMTAVSEFEFNVILSSSSVKFKTSTEDPVTCSWFVYIFFRSYSTEVATTMCLLIAKTVLRKFECANLFIFSGFRSVNKSKCSSVKCVNESRCVKRMKFHSFRPASARSETQHFNFHYKLTMSQFLITLSV